MALMSSQGPDPRSKIKHGVRTAWLTFVAALFVSPASVADVPTPPTDAARRLPLLLRKLDGTPRLLYVTAHPDDEDCGFLAWLTHGRGVETALMTLTRGEGGQNEIGTELFDAIGVLRSGELEAAARYTGIRQYYSRATDFGYSFSVEETYEKWGEDRILQDIIAVIREFRPDVIVTMNPGGEGGGQHHQASARLTAAAFDLAADASVWHDLGLPHRPRRLFHFAAAEEKANVCEIPLGGYDAVLGCSYAELGSRSRAMHKCQGMVRREPAFPERSARLVWSRGHDEEPRPISHPFEGLRDPLFEEGGSLTERGRRVREMAKAIREGYSAERPSTILPQLLELRSLVREWWPGTRGKAASPNGGDPTLMHKVRGTRLGEIIDEAIALASGVRIEARSPRGLVAAGSRLEVTVTAENHGPHTVAVHLFDWAPVVMIDEVERDSLQATLAPGERKSWQVGLLLRGKEGFDTIAQPVEPGPGFADPHAAPSDALYPVWETLAVGGEVRQGEIWVPLPRVPVEHLSVRASFPELKRAAVHIVPDPSIRVARPVLPIPVRDGAAPVVEVEFLVSSLEARSVEVGTSLPRGWSVEPATTVVRTKGDGIEVPVRFTVTGPEGATGDAYVYGGAGVTGAERVGDRGYLVVDYPHIRRGVLAQGARVRLVSFPCTVTSRRVGYVMGPGDEVPAALARLGIETTLLDAEALLKGDLERFDVIVTGIRAYKVRDDLAAAQQRLFEWVEAGGTLIAQYNKFEFNAGAGESGGSLFAPFRGAKVGRRRVTVEEGPVRVTLPQHPLFREPNHIDEADWEGWVQERGLYFLDVLNPADARYRDLLELEDPWPYNAGKKGGALVEVTMGEGRWIYVGLGLFRQLPAGVPGAYRLLANLIAR